MKSWFYAGIGCFACLLQAPVAITQDGPATSKGQVAAWEAMKYGMFIHFNMNTYAGCDR
jgi:hypothetical protein